MLSEVPKNGPDGRLQLHASTVVIAGRAVAICGPAGSGKSGFALALMGRGALLLADDITWLETKGDSLMAICPPTLSGRIEARGLGILNATPAPSAPLHLIVDLGVPEAERLPERKFTTLLGHDIQMFHTPENTYFMDAVLHYMTSGMSREQRT